MTNDVWGGMRDVWRRAPETDVAALVIRARRARRLSGLWRTGTAVLSLGLLAMAVGHAATPSEAFVAFGIGVTIAVAWVTALVAERREREVVAEAGDRYVAARLEVLRRHVNVLRFILVVVVLELVFLLPWWFEGIPIHFGSLASVAALFTLWLPLLGITAVLIWTVRRWRRSQRELAALVRHSSE
jgi:hypothetical protein